MVLNDFKAIEGDRELGIRPLPVQMGVRRAALFACAIMAAPQLAVIGMLLWQGSTLEAAIVSGLLLAQAAMMPVLVRAPRERAPLYNATGTTFFVLGMMVSAFAVRGGLLAGW